MAPGQARLPDLIIGGAPNGFQDIWNTMALPTPLWLGARFVTWLPTGAPEARGPRP